MPSPFTSPLPHQAFATWNHDASIWTFAAKWLQSTCLKTGPSQPQSTETGTPRFWSPKFLLSLGIWRSWRLVQFFFGKFKDMQTYCNYEVGPIDVVPCMGLSENSGVSKACCIRGYDSRYVSEVWFGLWFALAAPTAYFWRGRLGHGTAKWGLGMIGVCIGYDSGYDSGVQLFLETWEKKNCTCQILSKNAHLVY